jgi:hypothetical protein
MRVCRSSVGRHADVEGDLMKPLTFQASLELVGKFNDGSNQLEKLSH